ncbi:MAG: HRDC domain-containing protein [Deltaproteobacteria bacterium]|nr:HRDC domain-containing protein [Deltaproteobacteria bacterium]
MLIKIISLTFDSVRGNFDDAPVREFIKDKEVVSIDDHFFLRNEVPYRQEINPGMAPKGKRDEAWQDSLGEADMGVFNLLREWRLKRSREEGVPPYVLFTNKQLAEIAKGRPDSLANLSTIEGIGSQKLGKYGKDVLEITSVQVGSV